MNKSLKYLLKRKQDKDLPNDSWLALSDLKENGTRNFFTTFNELFNKIDSSNGLDLLNKCELDGQPCEIKIKVVPCTDNNFDYYTSVGNYNDGTLLFYLNTIRGVVNKVISGQTYSNKSILLDELKKKLKSNEYYLLYEVGDIISTNTETESPDKERPWLSILSCSFLPLKCSLVKIDNEN